jgi:hypothetical protein
VALHPILFPIDQPVMPETRQIGRGASIDALQAALTSAAHQWLIGERRIGKTSVAKAALSRLRSESAIALDIDLSNIRISTADHLADEIAAQAQAAGAGDPKHSSRQLASFGRRHRREAKALTAVLETLGFNDEAEAVDTVASVLAGAAESKPGLGAVLEALSIHARVSGQRVFLLLDEVHLLAELDGSEETVAQACHQADGPIVFVLAGSEESAARELREPGRPLAAVGQEFHLPAIAPEDWLQGLRQRFAEGAIEIADRELEAIIAASDCHPRRTMLIASKTQTQVLAMPHETAGPELVDLAISDARKDRAWR